MCENRIRRFAGLDVQTQNEVLNMNMNVNKGGWITYFFIEYEREFELTRLSHCVYVSMYV